MSRVREPLRLGKAVFVVLSTASVVAWAVSVAASKRHHPFNFWAVLALAILCVGALLWGVGRGRAAATPGVVHQHYYSGPVTMNIAADRAEGGAAVGDEKAAPASERETVGPSLVLPPQARPVLKLTDYVDFEAGEAPI